MTSRRLCGWLAIGIAALGAVASARPASPQDARVPSDRRVVVLAVPGLTWKDIDSPSLPRLRALLEDSAVANLSTRVTSVVSSPGEAYLTLGAGTRAVASSELAGLSFQSDEVFGPTNALDEHRRQHGMTTDADVVSLVWPLLVDENADAEFGGTIGTLGQALADAGVERGVVANADGADPLAFGEPFRREASLALADGTGTVDCGQVGSALLVADDTAPFGVRLDPQGVAVAVDRCSTPGSVVMVEASDLRRAAAFAPRATPALAAAAREAALAATDLLLADVLRRVDPARDAVVVVAPSTLPDPGLGVLGIRAPELEPGFLTSGSTRRDGYVLLTDVTPSIATLAGVELDEGAIEGRSVEVGATSVSGTERRRELVEGEAAALFRDRMLRPVVGAVVVAVSILALVATGTFALRRGASLRPWLERLALVLVALPSITYLAAWFPFHDWGAGAYWGFLAAGSLIVGVAASLLRGRWLRPLVAVYGLLVGVIVVSVVVLGSRLQLATVFGDSPINAGRFTGVNNVTFAFLFLAASVLASLAVERVPGARGRRVMVAVLVGVLVVDVAPMWGADVGGALAGVPALVVLAMGLARWRVRWQTVVLVGLGTVAVVGVLAALDLTRDSADRSHLGRLFERIGSEGSSGLTTVIERKLAANVRSLSESDWRYLFGPLLLVAGIVAWRGRSLVSTLVAALPVMRRAVPGFAALAVLGYAANDSGIAVPAAMLAALVPGLVYLACRVRPPEPAR